MPMMQGGGGGYGGGYGGGGSGGNFPPGMRGFAGGSPGFGNRGGGRGRGRRGMFGVFAGPGAWLTRIDDRGRGRGGHGGGGGDRHAPESTGVRFRKMVIKLGDEEVSSVELPGRPKLIKQDFDPVEDPPRLAKLLRRSWREGAPGVFDGFRIGWVPVPATTARLTRQSDSRTIQDTILCCSATTAIDQTRLATRGKGRGRGPNWGEAKGRR
jgi:nuclear cap-binding protein subunit 1